MTTKLKIIDLLDTLNELFGSFDDASEVLNQLIVLENVFLSTKTNYRY